jgi:prepilin-type N-terminal cleavage/methylation domain-containing protein
MSRRAFTLTELIIVVVIIAILAAMAAIGYTKTVERSYWREARDILLTVYAG